MMGTPSASTASASRDLEMVAAEGGPLLPAMGLGGPAAAAAAASSAASAASSASDWRPSTVTLLMQNAGRRPAKRDRCGVGGRVESGWEPVNDVGKFGRQMFDARTRCYSTPQGTHPVP